ncbi:DMT family transporter [Bacillus testis]|uniref:DMT family transporter n=1 Tax=Bacillus testis TaxID=1622072 RepID=UPI00067E9BDF|nr:DMT family transporter [Bacillus testis]
MNVSPMLKMVIAMSIFGSVGLFTVKTGIPAIQLVLVRCVFATVFLGGCWIAAGQHKKEIWQAREVFLTVLCGIFLVMNWVFLFKAFEVMPISVAISIYHLAPILLLILGAVCFREKIHLLSWLFILMCFGGSVLMIGIKASVSWEGLFSSGFIWALCAALFYALTMFFGKLIRHLSPYATTFIQTTVGILILLPFFDVHAFSHLSGMNWLFIVGTGFIHTGLVYYLFFDSIRQLPTVHMSALVFLDPAVAIMLDVALLGFRPSIWQVAGIILIFAGMAYTTFPKKSRIQQSHAEKNGF